MTGAGSMVRLGQDGKALQESGICKVQPLKRQSGQLEKARDPGQCSSLQSPKFTHNSGEQPNMSHEIVPTSSATLTFLLPVHDLESFHNWRSWSNWSGGSTSSSRAVIPRRKESESQLISAPSSNEQPPAGSNARAQDGKALQVLGARKPGRKPPLYGGPSGQVKQARDQAQQKSSQSPKSAPLTAEKTNIYRGSSQSPMSAPPTAVKTNISRRKSQSPKSAHPTAEKTKASRRKAVVSSMIPTIFLARHPGFKISLTKEEIMDDFIAITGKPFPASTLKGRRLRSKF